MSKLITTRHALGHFDWHGPSDGIFRTVQTSSHCSEPPYLREGFRAAVEGELGQSTDQYFDRGLVFGHPKHLSGQVLPIVLPRNSCVTRVDEVGDHAYLVFNPDKACDPEMRQFIKHQESRVFEKISTVKKQDDPYLALMLLMADYNFDGTINDDLRFNPQDSFHPPYLDVKRLARQIGNVYRDVKKSDLNPGDSVNKEMYARHRVAEFIEALEWGDFISPGIGARHDIMTAVENAIMVYSVMQHGKKYSLSELKGSEEYIHLPNWNEGLLEARCCPAT